MVAGWDVGSVPGTNAAGTSPADLGHVCLVVIWQSCRDSVRVPCLLQEQDIRVQHQDPVVQQVGLVGQAAEVVDQGCERRHGRW